LAFVLPILHMFDKFQPVDNQAVVIVPTKMLALQIINVFKEFNIKPGQMIGGADD
jgi:superfamily II DNA/RNA helicase